MVSPVALLLLATTLVASPAEADVAVCPGESDRYGDHKCSHDPTHRFCAQLLDANGQPLSWGPKGDFWEITGQKAFQWDDQIRANGGDSWCICMWAAARLITAAGCENVHLHCDATDVDYIVQQYSDGGVDLEPAKHCLQQKCPSAKVVQDSDAALPQLANDEGILSRGRLAVPGAVALCLGVAGLALSRLRSSRVSGKADTTADIE